MQARTYLGAFAVAVLLRACAPGDGAAQTKLAVKEKVGHKLVAQFALRVHRLHQLDEALAACKSQEYVHTCVQKKKKPDRSVVRLGARWWPSVRACVQACPYMRVCLACIAPMRECVIPTYRSLSCAGV
jgi:hypothetical protein